MNISESGLYSLATWDPLYSELPDFSLRWRWTDPNYAEFTPAELDLIRPIISSDAKLLSEYLSKYVSDYKIHSDMFPNSKYFDTRGSINGTNIVSQWLNAQVIESDPAIFPNSFPQGLCDLF